MATNEVTMRVVPKIAIEFDGVIQVHVPGHDGNTYATACGLDGGMDGYDPTTGQRPATMKPGAKIDCPDCINLFKAMKPYRDSDFKK